MMRGDEDVRGRERQGDIVLTPGQYVYSQDESKGGAVKTFVGPCVITPTGQDRPVKYDPQSRRFQAATFESATEQSPFARKGQYIILDNPASPRHEGQGGQNSGEHPAGGQNVNPADLLYGNTVNLPGPTFFALWPGQSATVVDGHTLRSNEYLEVEIIDEAAARENWESGIVRKSVDGDASEEEASTPVDGIPEDLSEGKIYIIRGDQVAFYIPPTGVRVIPDEDGTYVRDAVTLETLEYCQLFDENGNKRYERGAQVVFPQATEQFQEVEGNRKFRATEVNEISGLHVKVIEPYNDDGSEVTDPATADHKEGDELFITGPGAVVYPEATDRTGQESAIYFPRVEHSILKYGKKKKHYATSIPHAGEGRYLMERRTGVVETIRGPKQLLPDPRTHVIVRRPLSDRECRLWYPTKDGQANPEVLAYNRTLRTASQQAGTERAGYVSDSDYMSNSGFENLQSYAAAADMAEVESMGLTRGGVRRRKGRQEAGSFQPGDEFERGTSYTPPRTITLDTKFESVPTINVWTGYAVMVVSKSGGQRQCHVGPSTILLDYDQTLECLSLSTGKPKNTDNMKETVYLRVLNNKVSDVITLETSDHIPVQVKLSLLINFEGDPNKWFDVENYVKFATDHVRSILKGVVRKTNIEKFDADGVGIIRDTLLGVKPEEGGARPGMVFDENGMVIQDVEVLDISIQDESIRHLLKEAQHKTVRQNIQVRQAEEELSATQRQEEIKQEIAKAVASTATHQQQLERARLAQQLETEVLKVQNALAVAEEKKATVEAEEAVNNLSHTSALARDRAEADQKKAIQEALQTLQLQLLQAETSSTVDRFKASQEGFSEALLALGNQDTLEKVAKALSVQQLLGGKDFVEVVQKVFAGSPLEGAIQQIGQRAGLTGGTNRNSNTLSRTSVDGE
jgi:major vault protein